MSYIGGYIGGSLEKYNIAEAKKFPVSNWLCLSQHTDKKMAIIFLKSLVLMIMMIYINISCQ